MPPTLIDLVAGVLNMPADQLTPDSGPKTVSKWDSLAHVTIAAAVEQTYGVVLTMPEILSIKSIGGMQQILQRHGVAPSDPGSAAS